MNKLRKIDKQEQKAREKIAAMQAMLRQIGDQRTEQENLQIVQKIRAFKLSRDELYAFFDNNVLPASLAGAIGTAGTQEQETIYSRRDDTHRSGPVEQDADAGMSGDTDDTADDESEDMSDDE